MTKLGLISGTVKIEEYNPKWKDEFLKEKEVLEKQLQDYDVNIQHIGSTSIVGCLAKPIIDIAIGVESLEYGEQLILVLCNIGYIYDGDIPGRHFFKKKYEELSTHYIHVEPVHGELWNNHILFRDYLNKHPQLIIEYSNLKKSLEKDFSGNRSNYVIGKNPFIEKVIKTAKKEKSKSLIIKNNNRRD
ncbi:GrpB family protein [Clostridium sp. UBA1056]|uniref:GrpB family protein n=1 Tax=unclassified Clostridium TaxID=2614128 RepID=UPI0032177255